MTRPASPWRRLTGSVRLRTTLAATAIVAVTLAAGSGVLLWRFKASLDANRRDAAVARAEDLASLAATGKLPTVLALPNQDATYAQVIDAAGTVVAASANIEGEPPLGRPAPYRSGPTVRAVTASPIDGDGASQLVTVAAGTPARPLTVFVGYSLVGSDFAVHDIELALVFGLPIVLAVVSRTAWVIVGRALRPIDAIRAEVAEITASGLHRRVPEPASGDEVARLAETMNTMLDRLEVAVDAQRAFVADASHELRSPLASLRAQLEIGLAAGPDADWPIVATGALAEEARIEQLVRDLLLLARLDRGAPRHEGEGRPTDVVDLADVVATEIAARPPRPGVSVRADTTGPVPAAMAPGLARRVVANLVDNAAHHATAEVTVSVRAAGDGKAEMAVADDGPGVAPADRQRVFERFTRLDEARGADDGGAGLGLAIVRDLVTRHGGTVEFVDAPHGACVVVRLPPAPAPGAPSPGSALAQ